MGNEVNLRQLEYFVAVAESGSILQASKLVHISQSSISVQIKALEEELGVTLLKRYRDGILLTSEGVEFLLHARGVLSAATAARLSMQEFQASPTGFVTVGIPGSLAGIFTADLVERVTEQLPGVQLRVVGGLSGHTRQWILDGRMDFGLVFDEAEQTGVDVKCLFLEKLYFAGPRDREERDELSTSNGKISMNAIASLPLIIPGPGYGIRMLIERSAKAAGVELFIKAEIDATEQISEMISRGSFYTILSLAALRTSPAMERITTMAIVPPIVRTVSLVHASHRPLSPAAREVRIIFLEIIREKSTETWWKPALVEILI